MHSSPCRALGYSNEACAIDGYMKAIGIIPARYGSTRFEGKVLARIGGRPMIQHVCERAAQATALDRVIVATDDERVADVVRGFGGDAVMTSPDHVSGTDRVAEAAASLEADVIVNIQGDEPLISPRAIDQAVEPFAYRPDVDMTTLCRAITDDGRLNDPNVVKVVSDRQSFALYFSRSAIPYARSPAGMEAFEHLGLYAYRKPVLPKLAALAPSKLETIEGLEQLRALENGYKIFVLLTEEEMGPSVDTPEDLIKAEAYLAAANRR